MKRTHLYLITVGGLLGLIFGGSATYAFMKDKSSIYASEVIVRKISVNLGYLQGMLKRRPAQSTEVENVEFKYWTIVEEFRWDGAGVDAGLLPSISFSWVQVGTFGNPSRYVLISDDLGPPMGYHWIEAEQHPGSESSILRDTRYSGGLTRREKDWEAFKPWTRKAKRNVPSNP